MHRALLSAVLSLSVLFGTVVAAQDASYTFTNLDIPSEGGNNQAFVFDINNTGQVVGYYNTLWPDAAGTRGFLYDHGTFTTLHHPDAALGTLALGINDAMQTVGHYVDSLGRSHGFVYDHRDWKKPWEFMLPGVFPATWDQHRMSDTSDGKWCASPR
jgi:probable HAF family extracellular repeat protein